MARSLVLIAALAGAAFAADTTAVQVLFGEAFPMPGSVIHADATATTLSINCPPDSEKCRRSGAGAIITQGPSTCKWDAQIPAETGTVVISLGSNCKLDPAKDEAHCTFVSTSGTSSTSQQMVVSKYSEQMHPVQITAGAEKLTAANTNAAGPMVTQNAVWAGVAAVVGGVLAL